MTVDLVINLKIITQNNVWKYNVPTKYDELIKLGQRVQVEFNKQIIYGFVVNIYNENAIDELSSIVGIIDAKSYVTKRDLNLVKYLTNNYYSKTIDYLNLFIPKFNDSKTIKVFIPNNINDLSKIELNYFNKNGYVKNNSNLTNYETKIIKQETKPLMNRYASIICTIEEFDNYYINQKSNKVKSFLQILSNNDLIKINSQMISNKDLVKLENDNIIKVTEKEKYFDIDIDPHVVENKINTLNDEQKEVFDEININSNGEYLIQGVTGSGKTHIFIELIKEVNKKGKIAYLLIPEIGLSYKIFEKISMYISKSYIYHYKMPQSYKREMYKNLKNNNLNCIVGTRSTLFLNNENIGIIIFDEEHDEDYHQITNPRYNSKEIAKLISYNDSFPIIYSSATPSIETMYDENIKKLKLENKFNNMESEKLIIRHNVSKHFISSRLEQLILKNIEKDEQTILLFNKKAYAQYYQCEKCGYIDKCPICEQSRKVYVKKQMLKCSFCDTSSKLYNTCISCSNNTLTYKGQGIEKVEEELRNKFPNVEIVTIDADVFNKEKSIKKISSDIDSNKIKIILGTQIISKGLDFKNITLGAIIDADNSLNFPSFRAKEKSFQLFNQFLGRVGRHKNGKIVIQTNDPKNNLWQKILDSNYNDFVKDELLFRNEFNMPPFVNIVNIQIRDKDINMCFEKIVEVHRFINTVKKTKDIFVPHINKIGIFYILQFDVIYTNYENNEISKLLNKTKLKYNKYNIHILVNNPNMF